jgi:hypothetical protein
MITKGTLYYFEAHDGQHFNKIVVKVLEQKEDLCWVQVIRTIPHESTMYAIDNCFRITAHSLNLYVPDQLSIPLIL